MRTGKQIKRRIANLRLTTAPHPKTGKPVIVWSHSRFILECGHVVPAAPACCKYRGAHTVTAMVFLSFMETKGDWRELAMKKVCRDCMAGNPPDFGLLSMQDADRIGMSHDEWVKGPESGWRMTT